MEKNPDYSCVGEAAALTARIACHTNDMNHQRPAALTAHARLVQREQSADAHADALVRAKNRKEHATAVVTSSAQNAVFAAACSPVEDTERVELLTGFLLEHARLTDRLLPLPLSRENEARLAELFNPPAAGLVGVGPVLGTSRGWGEHRVGPPPRGRRGPAQRRHGGRALQRASPSRPGRLRPREDHHRV